MRNKNTRDSRAAGFTLIELSIVLVIIGLIVGGVLVGQDLIRSAETRAQLSQIEKYNSAVNTFKSKFNYIPGDMRPEVATQFGFTVGTSCTGQALGARDGNGLLDGNYSVTLQLQQSAGEPNLFWQDISSNAAGNLIDGTFPNSGGSYVTCGTSISMVKITIPYYYPAAKIGHGNFVYVYETSGTNWYGVSAVTNVSGGAVMLSGANLPVMQAYNMDKKVDDGIPTTGSVQATYLNNSSPGTSPAIAPNNTTSGGDATTCYDTTTGTYSVTVNDGNGGNCALSFRFQ